MAEIENIPDSAIDLSETPELDDAFFAKARLVVPERPGKKPVTVRLDADVLEWFKAQGKGHLTRMNAVLRAYMLAHKER